MFDIVKKSFTYPFSNISKLIVIVILVFLSNCMVLISLSDISEELFSQFLASDWAIVLTIISIVIQIYLLGYGVSILKNSTNDRMPDFNVKMNFINAFKYIAVSIIYLIVPFLIFIALSYVMGVNNYNFDLVTFSFTHTTYINSDTSVISTAIPTFEVILVLVVSFILFLIFGLFEIVGICRLAKFDSLKEAISFKKVFEEVKLLKWRLLGGIILLFLISLILEFVFSLFNHFRFGIIIFLIGQAYLFCLNYRFIGLLYESD